MFIEFLILIRKNVIVIINLSALASVDNNNCSIENIAFSANLKQTAYVVFQTLLLRRKAENLLFS